MLYQFDTKTENNPYQTEHDELFAAIAKGEYKFADAENGAKSTMTSYPWTNGDLFRTGNGMG